MRYRRKHSYKSIIISFFGVGCSVIGLILVLNPQFRIPGLGFFITGIANLFLGSTHGFMDPTPGGRLYFRLSVILYLVGLPLLVLGLFGSDK